MADDDFSMWWDEDADRLNKLAEDARKFAVKLPKEKEEGDWEDAVEEERAFCATGAGGGIDNSCGSSGGTNAVVREVLSSISKTGGFTVHPVTGQSPTTGFMCATVPGAEKVLAGREDITATTISGYFSEHADFLSANPQLHLGGWIDPESGKVYLDLSERFETEAEATAAAVKHKQIAIWDLANGREVRIKGGDNGRRSEQEKVGAVRLPARSNSGADRRSLAKGSRRDHGREEEARSGVDCGRGPGGIFGPGNKCQENAGSAPQTQEPLTPSDVADAFAVPPSLRGAREVKTDDSGRLPYSLKKVGVSLDDAAKVCAFAGSDATVSIIDGTIHEQYPRDPSSPASSAVTFISDRDVDGIESGVQVITTLSRNSEGALSLSYEMLGVSPEAQKSSPVKLAREIYKGVTQSITEGERLGLSEVKMLAAGDKDHASFKGYRIWPRLGFDGAIPREAVTPKWSKRLGFFEPYGSNIPDDVLSPKAQAEKKSGSLTIQSLYETTAGQKWWEEHGSSMPMTLRVGDDSDAGWQRFSRIRDKVNSRGMDSIMECLDIEWRAIRSEVESRAFCPTGEGNGIDNSCSSSGGTGVASGKPASVRVQSDSELDGSMQTLGLSGVDDVLALGGGNIRGAEVAIKADGNGFIYVSSVSPIDRDNSSAGQFHTSVSISEGEDGKELGLETLGLTGYATELPRATQTKVMSLVSEKVAESIDTAEKNGFAKVTTFAVGDAKSPYKGYRLWPQFGFDGDVPRDIAKRIPPEIVLKSKGIEPPAPGSSSIPHDLVLKGLASRHRNSLTIQELISSTEGDRWWDENGGDVNLTLDLRDKGSAGYKKWSQMKARLPKLRERNKSRSFFDSLVEERAFCATGEGGGIDNSCSADDNGPTNAFGERLDVFERRPSGDTGGGGVTDAPRETLQWTSGKTIPDAFETVVAASPVARDDSGSIKTEVFKRSDISPFAGKEYVSPTACGRYLAEMTAQTRGPAIDSKKPLSEDATAFLVESMVQQVQSAESRGYTPAFYSQGERQRQIEAYSQIHPILRGGRTASGVCIGQEDASGNCAQGDSVTPEGEFLFRAVQALLSPQASPMPNMQRADEVLTNFFENPDPEKAALGAGSVAGNASKVAKANLARLQAVIDKVGLTEAARIFSEPPMRAGDLDDFFEEKLGLKGFKAGGYSVDTVVPIFSVFGPKVGPFFANNNGDLDALTADVWFSRTWGRLTGELVQETNPTLAKSHADVLSRRMRYVTDEDLSGTDREAFTAAVEQMRKTGEIPASVAAWSEARAKRYGKEGFNKGVKGVRDREVARLSIAIQNNLASTLDDPGTTVRRSNMIEVIKEVSLRTGHPPAFVQDLLWQDEQDVWAAAGARTSTEVGEASLFSTGIDKMVADPMIRFPIRKAAEAAQKKSKPSRVKKRSLGDDYLDDEGSFDFGRGWIEQLSFDMETEDVSPEEFADAFVAFLASRKDDLDFDEIANLAFESRADGKHVFSVKNAPKHGYASLGFDAKLPEEVRSSLPESISHCQTLIDLHVTPEGRDWWAKNGRRLEVSLDFSDSEAPQSRMFDRFARDGRHPSWDDIIEEGILDDYGDA